MSLKKLSLATAVVVVLSGCGNPKIAGEASIGGMQTTAYQMHIKDVGIVWMIECPGWANDWGNCWARANNLCPTGFALIDQSGNVGSTTAAISTNGGYVAQKTERLATVSCNPEG